MQYAARMSKPSRFRRVGAFLTRTRNFVMNTVFIVILIFVLFAVIDAFDTPGVPADSALVLNPQGEIVEQTVPLDPFSALWTSDTVREADIHELLRAIDHAAADDRIKMIVLDLDDLTWASAAHAESLGRALARFNDAGKETIAVGNDLGQSQYAIASHADAVYLHSSGGLYLPGYEAVRSYFKSLFDKLKFNVHVFRVGTYKAAVEPFTRDDMSAAARAANQELVDGLWAAYRQRIVANRQLDTETFDGYAEAFDAALAAAGGDMGRAALESGMVDELMSADQMRSRIADTVGRDDDGDINGIGYKAYLKALGPRQPEHENIGLIFVRGVIQMGDDKSAAAADNLVELIRRAREDPAVQALVVRVDSPGGSAFASELIREELELVRLAGKPVVMSMGSVAASGGYWISSTADRILAHPTTITGSIGIFAMFLTMQDSLSSIGINTDGVGSIPTGGAPDPLRALSGPQQRVIQSNIEHGYRKFINLVARGRDMTPEAVDEVAQGRVWLGERALELGLVDGLGGLTDAVAAAAELAELEDYGVKRFTLPLSPRDVLIQQLMDSAQSAAPSRLAGLLRDAWNTAEALNDPQHVYAICETCLSLKR